MSALSDSRIAVFSSFARSNSLVEENVERRFLSLGVVGAVKRALPPLPCRVTVRCIMERAAEPISLPALLLRREVLLSPVAGSCVPVIYSGLLAYLKLKWLLDCYESQTQCSLRWWLQHCYWSLYVNTDDNRYSVIDRYL